MVIGGYVNFHFQFVPIPPSTIQAWDRKILTALSKKTGFSENIAHVHHALPNLCGNHHFRLLSTLYPAIQISETMIRLNDDGSLINRLARKQLQDLNKIRCAQSCAFSHPTDCSSDATNNQLSTVEKCLAQTGFSIHTDTFPASFTSSRSNDKLILETLPPEKRTIYTDKINELQTHFVSCYATEDGLSFIDEKTAIARNLIGHRTPNWFKALRTELCGDFSKYSLLPQYTIGRKASPNDGQQPPDPSAPIQPRIDPYANDWHSQTPPITHGPVYIGTGDGSALKKDSTIPSGYSMLPVQNGTQGCTGRIPGSGGNFKAEMIAQRAFFKSAPQNLPAIGVSDNTSVKHAFENGPPITTRRRVRRPDRTTQNMFEHTNQEREQIGQTNDAIVWIKAHMTTRCGPINNTHDK